MSENKFTHLGLLFRPKRRSPKRKIKENIQELIPLNLFLIRKKRLRRFQCILRIEIKYLHSIHCNGSKILIIERLGFHGVKS